jgi:hypothetical protein
MMLCDRADRLHREGRRTDMSSTHRPSKGAGSGLAKPVAVAVALKVAALAVLYCAFFVPRPLVDSAATAILGLPR